ncbi:LacI family DNA-binding transcriptional regulator [Priestia koreensis]|uniref:LacI family transcriptional regulator n=1 Tax=Priestia koreensis TaxID=284581 RepID=A0A0M0LHI7_9BACI|nr:LacI family DNA-binding transcriptional regulator [Priestia koreensis]KOO50382.1 LacI family transcriptional regulator [Priestia koreensis]
MSNIRTIAERAGVSVTTVSRVLNDHPYVSEEKRLAVKRVIDELQYTKNINAVHLVKGQTYMIGVILPYVNHPYYNQIIEGIAKEALLHGYKLVICQTNYQVDKEKEALEMLKVKQVDGLVICSRESDWAIIESYERFGPIVMCEEAKDRLVSSVYINHYDGFKLGMEYFISKGHTSIGCCLARPNSENSKKRRNAYQDVLQQVDIKDREDWVFYGCLTIEDGEGVAEKLFQMGDRPEALLVSSDQVAAGIITKSQQLGMNVPEDLSVIGFDNHPISRALGITTIEHPGLEMGQKAFTQIYKQIVQKESSSDHELSFQLIERHSVCNKAERSE